MHTQLLSRVQLFASLWTIAYQVPLSQEYWSGLLLTPEALPDPGIKPVPFVSPALAGGFLTIESPGKP